MFNISTNEEQRALILKSLISGVAWLHNNINLHDTQHDVLVCDK